MTLSAIWPPSVARVLAFVAVVAPTAAHAQAFIGPGDGTAESVVPFLCFDAGASAATIELSLMEQAALARMNPMPAELLFAPKFNANQSWGVGDGTPIELTWSLVPDGTRISDRQVSLSLQSDMFVKMDAQFAGAGGREVWIGQIQAGFDRWSEITGIRFRRVSLPGQDWDEGTDQSFSSSDRSSTRGQIRIGMARIDGPGGTLGYNYLPGGGGDMVLDSDENWSLAPNFLLLRNAVTHELGHALGLNHVCSGDARFLMEPRIDNNMEGPQHDGIRGVHKLYGDAAEPNGSRSAAFDLGTLRAGGSLSMGTTPGPELEAPASVLSLRDSGDEDWFSFELTESIELSAAIVPVGLVYEDGDQDFLTGVCQAGPIIDTAPLLDLAIELVDDSGAVVASSDAQASGQSETLSGISVGPGMYAVRVTGVPDGISTGAEVQLYTIELGAVGAGPGCIADVTTLGATIEGAVGYGVPDGIVDLDDLGIFLARWLAGEPSTDLTTTGDTLGGVPDGIVDLDDLSFFINAWLAGCP
ncbi:MAG: GC-type dockerin domain-anchored protein [Planctomycetota bacterium]